MEFNDEELVIIHSILNTVIVALENKKHFKTKQDILCLEKFKPLLNKINKYMEGK